MTAALASIAKSEPPLPLPFLRRFYRYQYQWVDTAILEDTGEITLTYGVGLDAPRVEIIQAPGKYNAIEWLDILHFTEEDAPGVDSALVEVQDEHRELWGREIAWCQKAVAEAKQLLKAAKLREEGSKKILERAQSDASAVIEKAKHSCIEITKDGAEQAFRASPDYALLRALMAAAKSQVPASLEAARQLDDWLTGRRYAEGAFEFGNATAEVREDIAAAVERTRQDPAHAPIYHQMSAGVVSTTFELAQRQQGVLGRRLLASQARGVPLSSLGSVGIAAASLVTKVTTKVTMR